MECYFNDVRLELNDNWWHIITLKVNRNIIFSIYQIKGVNQSFWIYNLAADQDTTVWMYLKVF